MQILVLEASTSSAKAMVFDSSRGVLSLKTTPYQKRYSDGITQDAKQVLLELCALARPLVRGRDIQAVSVVGAWHNLLLLDENNEPASRSYSWAYNQAAPYADTLRKNKEKTLELYHKTGCMVHSTYPAYRLPYLKQQGLTLQKGQKVSCQGSYIFSQLTGDLVESVSMASASGFLNIHTLQWEQEALWLSGIDESYFAALKTHLDVYGLSRRGCELLSLRENTPVIPAHPDGAMNQVGEGALQDNVMTISMGTSGALRMANNAAALPDKPGTWCYYAPGKWLVGAATAGCTNCLDWYSQKVLRGQYTLNQLDGMIGALNTKTPDFLPFIAGERCPGWDDSRLGGFLNAGQEHGTAEFYLAILKGVVFNLFQCYTLLGSMKKPPEEIRVSGGVAHSEKWSCILASCLGKEIRVSNEGQASMMGGCALALFYLGAIKSLHEFDFASYRTVAPNEELQNFLAKDYARWQTLYHQRTV